MLVDKNLSSDYNSFGVQRKNPLRFFCTYGVSFLYIFVLALFVFNYLTMARVRVLENEVEALKQTLSSVRLLDDNLIRDIIGFEDDEDIEAYDSDQDPKIVVSDGNAEYSDYENYEDKSNETDTKRNEDSYTKLLKKLTKLDDSGPTTPTPPNESTGARQKRNILAATDDGVIINSESYAERKAKGVTSIYDSKDDTVTQYPARPSSVRTSWPVYPYSYATAAYYRHTTTKPTKSPNVYIRSSRVKHFEDKSKAFRQKVKLVNLKSLDSYQDSNEDTTTYVPPITIVRNAGYRRRTIKHLPSVHYHGDTSKYRFGTDDNFYGNDQLRHLNDMFVDWKATEWVDTLRMHNHFTLENGSVSVKQSGLYLVYSQIYYMDTHDRVGYKVYKNDKVILECAITSPSINGGMKSNTCYTAGVEHFRAGDKLWLKDIEQRLSLFAGGKSFFGMVKLGNISV